MAKIDIICYHRRIMLGGVGHRYRTGGRKAVVRCGDGSRPRAEREYLTAVYGYDAFVAAFPAYGSVRSGDKFAHAAERERERCAVKRHTVGILAGTGSGSDYFHS